MGRPSDPNAQKPEYWTNYHRVNRCIVKIGRSWKARSVVDKNPWTQLSLTLTTGAAVLIWGMSEEDLDTDDFWNDH